MTSTLNNSPKAKQFQEELNALLAKYQYRLNPQLEFTKFGITPIIGLEDVVPPKDGIPVPQPTTVGAAMPGIPAGVKITNLSKAQVKKIKKNLKVPKGKKK